MTYVMTNPSDMDELPDFQCDNCGGLVSYDGEHGVTTYGYHGTYACKSCKTREYIVVQKNDPGNAWIIVEQRPV